MPSGIYYRSEERLNEIRHLRNGKTPWNKGLTKKTSDILKLNGKKISTIKKNRVEPIRTKEWKDNISKSLKGKLKPWNANKNKTPLNLGGKYIVLHVDGLSIVEHRYNVEKFLNRKLSKQEKIHHIDGDKTNNDLSNLYIFKSNSDHILYEHMICYYAKRFLAGKISYSEFEKLCHLDSVSEFMGENKPDLIDSKLLIHKDNEAEAIVNTMGTVRD